VLGFLTKLLSGVGFDGLMDLSPSGCCSVDERQLSLLPVEWAYLAVNVGLVFWRFCRERC